MKTPVLDPTPEAPPCCSGAAARRTAVAPSRGEQSLRDVPVDSGPATRAARARGTRSPSFVGIVALGILLVGWLFNAVL